MLYSISMLASAAETNSDTIIVSAQKQNEILNLQGLDISYQIFSIIGFILGAGGLLGAFIIFGQLSQQKKSHLFSVYHNVICMLDDINVRAARHYVYNMNRDAFDKEGWLTLDTITDSGNNIIYIDNKSKAEITCRQFDKLGLLIREGIVPINIVALFYSYPALKCWYQLAPYIRAVRSEKGRHQNGHMWHFEHLCRDIMIPCLKKEKTCWKGVILHDDLNHLIRDIESEPRYDGLDFAPKDRIWEIKS